MNEQQKIALIDFDGVINKLGLDRYTSEPVENVRAGLIELKRMKYRTIIHSSRTSEIVWKKHSAKRALQLIIAYSKRHDLPYDEICILPKLLADVIIDDRAIGFKNWEETIKEIKEKDNSRDNEIRRKQDEWARERFGK